MGWCNVENLSFSCFTSHALNHSCKEAERGKAAQELTTPTAGDVKTPASKGQAVAIQF